MTKKSHKIKKALNGNFTIFFTSLVAAILLTVIYKKERAQKVKILALKRLIERTSDAKNEFILQSAKEVKSFVFEIQSSANNIKKDLEDRQKAGQRFDKNIALSDSIIDSSRELASFIKDMIELNQHENLELTIDKNDHQADILRIVKRSVKLLETIADSSNVTLIKKIEDTLNQLSEIEPHKVKQIIINLMPNKSGKKSSVKVVVHNDNDE